MAVASIYGFRQNPKAFFDWVRPLAIKTVQAQPNPAHYALAELESLLLSRSKRFTLITQNVDGLHQRAGSQNVLKKHNRHSIFFNIIKSGCIIFCKLQRFFMKCIHFLLIFVFSSAFC